MDNSPATQLYDMLAAKDFEVQVLDTKTGQPPVNDQGESDISDGDLFLFDWDSESGKNYGSVQIFLSKDKNLILTYGDNLGRGMDPEDKDEWFDFMYQLKNFASRNFLNFTPGNYAKLKHSLATMSNVKESTNVKECILESYYGNRKISYTGNPTEARLMIKHNRDIAEGDARFRHVESLFIETADGERFRLPFKNLAGGRAMLEHVRSGGRPYDIRGSHIVEMVEEMSVLGRFKRANQGRVFEGTANDLVSRSNEYYESLRHNLKSLGSQRGYNKYFESWQPLELTKQDQLVEELKQLFIEQTLDTRIEQALPVLARLQQDHSMKELHEFVEHVDNMAKGTWATPDTPEAQKQLLTILTLDSIPVGADAEDLTVQLDDVLGDDELFDQLRALADEDAGADAKPVILARMEQLRGMPGIDDVLDQLAQGDTDETQPELADEFPQDDDSEEPDEQGVAEAQLDELSPNTLKSYREKKQDQLWDKWQSGDDTGVGKILTKLNQANKKIRKQGVAEVSAQQIPMSDYDQWRDRIDAAGGEIHTQKDRTRLTAQAWDGEIIGEFNLRTNQGYVVKQGMGEADNLATFEGNPDASGGNIMYEQELARLKSLLGKL